MLYVNQQPHTQVANTVAELAETLALPAQGIALVLNQQLLPRTVWAQTPLPDNADHHIEIFQLVAGG
ncbi:sulfur carrier protein ThiS [Rheinheimera sp.]|jgi:sulfur carrier protein|uniref:sulfur carrier protein ThiS n=1 Tax=Rheinheimera sp. TaxID=1869214 RepID=UPI003D2E6D46